MAEKLNKKKVEGMWEHVKHGALTKAGGIKGAPNTPTNRKRLNFLANFSGDPATKAKARARLNKMKKAAGS
jgi:hypothetical protein